MKEEREILKKATQFFAGLKHKDLGLSKNTHTASQPIGCVMSLASAHACYAHSATVLPAEGSGLT